MFRKVVEICPSLRLLIYRDGVHLDFIGDELRVPADELLEVADALTDAHTTIWRRRRENQLEALEERLREDRPGFRFQDSAWPLPRRLTVSSTDDSITVEYLEMEVEEITPDQLARLLKATKGESSE